MTSGNMTRPLASGEAAEALIPQKAPFVLIDTLVSTTTDTFCSAFTIPAEHVLVNNGKLLEAGLIENAAQTAALGMGYTAKQLGAPPPLGFIGAISKLAVTGRAAVGDRLETTVIVRYEVMSARVLEANVHCGGKLLATMEMKVFIIDPNANGPQG